MMRYMPDEAVSSVEITVTITKTYRMMVPSCDPDYCHDLAGDMTLEELEREATLIDTDYEIDKIEATIEHEPRRPSFYRC